MGAHASTGKLFESSKPRGGKLVKLPHKRTDNNKVAAPALAFA